LSLTFLLPELHSHLPNALSYTLPTAMAEPM